MDRMTNPGSPFIPASKRQAHDVRRGFDRIWVTQQGGKTEIKLEYLSAETGRGEFLTSPTGALESGRWTPPKKQKGAELGPEELRGRFEAEIDFWLHKVGRVTGRWPFEALTGETAVISSVATPLRSALAPAAQAKRKVLWISPPDRSRRIF